MTGDSEAWTVPFGDNNKLVVLSVSLKLNGAKPLQQIGALPASLNPIPSDHVRMALTETQILAVYDAKGNLCAWGAAANTSVQQFGTVFYLANA